MTELATAVQESGKKKVKTLVTKAYCLGPHHVQMIEEFREKLGINSASRAVRAMIEKAAQGG